MDNKREQILQATEKLIATKGLHALSMQMVAKEANVAAGTIYRYFKDKDDLITQLRNEALQYFAQQVLSGIEQGTDKEKFTRIWFNLIDIDKRCDANSMTLELYFSLPGIDSIEQQDYEKVVFSSLIEFFEQGVASGKFQQLSTELLFAIAFEPAVSLSWKIRRRNMQFTQNELEQTCNICWRAIQIQPQTISNHVESSDR